MKEIRASVGVGPLRILTSFTLGDIFWGAFIGSLICCFGWLMAQYGAPADVPQPAPSVTTTYSRP